MGKSRFLFFTIIAIGTLFRIFTAITFQSCAWIDEMWVVLSPAYKLAFGAGELKGDWVNGIRSWLPPSLLAVQLRFLDLLGVLLIPLALTF